MPPPDAALSAALALLAREEEVRYAEVRFVDERTERLSVREQPSGASDERGEPWGSAFGFSVRARGASRAPPI